MSVFWVWVVLQAGMLGLEDWPRPRGQNSWPRPRGYRPWPRPCRLGLGLMVLALASKVLASLTSLQALVILLSIFAHLLSHLVTRVFIFTLYSFL